MGGAFGNFFKYAFTLGAGTAALYACFLALLIDPTIRSHKLYRRHESSLVAEEAGFVSDFTSRHGFRLLRDDPEARLVIHMHGAGGTVGSGYRVPNYRALSAGQPGKIHVITFDYRGFGRSSGSPSEKGLITDAITVSDWALKVAGIALSRILLFGQSLGCAVALSASEHYALQSPPAVFAGTILVAHFADVATLLSTYQIAQTFPLISPLARFPRLFNYLKGFLRVEWSNIDRIARYVRTNEENGEKYRITIIHAEDDWNIPWLHSRILFQTAVNACSPVGVTQEALELERADGVRDLGAAGTVMEWRTDNGTIREEILRTGLHDAIMSYPTITIAIMRSFQASDSPCTC